MATPIQADPNGVIPLGWEYPGQYQVYSFLEPTGPGILSLMVAVKYPGCTNEYSTTKDYLIVLKDYLNRVGIKELDKAKHRWHITIMQDFVKTHPEQQWMLDSMIKTFEEDYGEKHD